MDSVVESTPSRPNSSREAPGSASLTERIPPQDLEAEQALLGSMMLHRDAIGDVLPIIHRNESERFYRPDHRQVFEVLVDMYDRGDAIDLVTFKDELNRRDLLQAVGGEDYILRLVESVPSHLNAEYYARIVCDKALLRQLIIASGRMMDEAYRHGDDAREILDRAEQMLFEVTDQRITEQATQLREYLDEIFRQIESREGHYLTGVPSGFTELDDLMSGMQRGEMIIIAARPSMGKCLAAGSQMVQPDGSIASIEQICTRRGDRTLTLDDDWTFRFTDPSDFIDDGIKPVFRVTTRLGRSVDCTLTHPFLTVGGWKPLRSLKSGDYIAVPRVIQVFGARHIPDAEARLLGLLIGDGGLTNGNPRFTNSNPAIQADFLEALAEFGGVVARVEDSRGTRSPSFCVASDLKAVSAVRSAFAAALAGWLQTSGRSQGSLAADVDVSPALVTLWLQGAVAPSAATTKRLCAVLGVAECELFPWGGDSARKNAKNRLTRWLEALGLQGLGSADKFVPEVIFTAPRRSVALFLNRLFATDGWATVLASGQAQLGYASVSACLARQVQHLLLRFGIIASVRRRSVRYRDGRRTAWQLDITDAKSIRTFIDEIGILGKQQALDEVLAALRTKRHQTNRDLVPLEVWDLIMSEKGALSWARLAEQLGYGARHNLHAFRRGLSRRRLLQFAEVLDSDRLRRLGESQVYWDRIVSIEYLGEQQVYDLTIPETHNFVANDVCVHNTAIGLNVAENVASRANVPAAFFSMEMSKQAIAQRLLCSRGRVDSHKLRRGMLTDMEIQHLAAVCGELREVPLFIDDTPGMSVLELRAKARRLRTRFNIEAVFVDYLQLMRAPGRVESRQQEVAEISRGLKALARELNIPVVVMAQLNRNPEGRSDNKPRMSDLRESGAIEQDADVILLLHREEYYKGENCPEDLRNIAEVIIAKQRNGPVGTVKLFFNQALTRFDNLAVGSDVSYAVPSVVYSSEGPGLPPEEPAPF